MNPATADALALAQRTEWSRLVARMIRITGDWALAEDCVQEAFLRAWEVWPRDGVPTRPGAWLSAAAKNRALDRWRRARVESAKLSLFEASDGVDITREDDLLALMFTCCHPALSLEARVALTLRCVAGLATDAVARAFLVSEDTMTRRLTRARAKVQNAGIPFEVPHDPWKTERLAGVFGVLYLLFNQGNDAGPGELERETLAPEAIRLTRLLVELCPGEPEARGLLSLMLLTHARRPARFGPEGIVTLELQDRSLWDKAAVDEGLAVLDDALSVGAPGPYTLQAAVAGCHARARRAEDTDFARIAGLYARLETLSPTPVVRLNRAVARALAEGPGVGLVLLEALADDPALSQYYLLPAAKADFLRKLGRNAEAAQAYAQAEALAPGAAERRFLAQKRQELDASR